MISLKILANHKEFVIIATRIIYIIKILSLNMI